MNSRFRPSTSVAAPPTRRSRVTQFAATPPDSVASQWRAASSGNRPGCHRGSLAAGTGHGRHVAPSECITRYQQARVSCGASTRPRLFASLIVAGCGCAVDRTRELCPQEPPHVERLYLSRCIRFAQHCAVMAGVDDRRRRPGRSAHRRPAGPHSFRKWAFLTPPNRNPAVRELGDERTMDSIHGPTTTIDSAGRESPALTCCAVVVACTMGLVADAVVVE
jgi:hypothetical protein